MRIEEADQVLVNAGFGPDNSIYRELQVHECYASRGPDESVGGAARARANDCMSSPTFGADVLAHPEPDFYIVGHKSYGRSPHFLLEAGYSQVGR